MIVAAFSQAIAQEKKPGIDRPSAAACPSGLHDVIVGIAPDGEIALRTTGATRLAAIRLPDEGPLRDQATAWLRRFAGQAVYVHGANDRDRWGRRAVRLQDGSGVGGPDLAGGLVEAGLALADPGRQNGLCTDDLLPAEAAARQRSLGVWADAGYKPINSDQPDRLKARIGTFTIVEGRIRTVGERAQWTYLNFGGRWAEDFTVIIPRRTWKRMIERGLDATAFRGRYVRVRGILEAWQGVSLTVEIPETIERLPR